jgi:hypothetical protein
MGNAWLLIGLILVLGRVAVRNMPTRFAFFGVGAWLSPGTYNLLTALAFLLGGYFLYLSRNE